MGVCNIDIGTHRVPRLIFYRMSSRIPGERKKMVHNFFVLAGIKDIQKWVLRFAKEATDTSVE